MLTYFIILDPLMCCIEADDFYKGLKDNHNLLNRFGTYIGIVYENITPVRAER
jgi:hypothetical protein